VIRLVAAAWRASRCGSGRAGRFRLDPGQIADLITCLKTLE
jgi:hypothetical protein